MKAVFITKPGGPETVQIKETADPNLANGQALVKVMAAGLNYAEVVIRTGFYPDAPAFPFIPGYEFSGIVEKTQKTAKIKVGDRVVGVTMFGAQAQLVAVSEDQLLRIPQNMEYDQAAALPVNYLTAYFAIHKLGNIRPGEKVLIHSCAGGVGTAAAQLALAEKAEVFGTTSSVEKIEYLKSLGVQHPINYKQTDFSKIIRETTGGKGINLVLDSVGGPAFKRSLNLLAPGGRIVCYGVTDMMASGRKKLWRIIWKYLTSPKVRVLDLVQNNRCIFGLALNRFIDDTSSIMPTLEKIIDLCSRGIIKPFISRSFKMEKAAEGHAWLESGQSIGKLVLEFNN
jgi:NADPH:quinone reductase-like Zn-dependent oxidoreductase